MIAVKTMPDLTSERQLWKFRLDEWNRNFAGISFRNFG